MDWNAIIAYFAERMNFIMTALAAAAVKVILTISEDPPEDETEKGRRKRAQRMWSGVVAGLLVAAVAAKPIVNWVDWIDEEQTYLVTAVLVLTGEHVTRRVMNPGDILNRLLTRFIGRGE